MTKTPSLEELSGSYGAATRAAIEARVEEDRWERTVAALRETAERKAEEARRAAVELDDAKEARDDARAERNRATAYAEEVAEALRAAVLRAKGY